MRRSSSIALALPLLVACLAVGEARGQPDASAPTPSATAGAAEAAPPEGLRSPRATMFTFLDAMARVREDPAAWARAISTLDLSRVNPERGKSLATEILGVLNRIGEVRRDRLPDEREASRRDLDRFVYFPDATPDHRLPGEVAESFTIEIVRAPAGAWRFSAETVSRVSAFYRAVEHVERRYGADETELSLSLQLREALPESLREGRFLALEYWQWLALFLVIALAVLVDQGFRLALRIFSDRFAARFGASVDAETTRLAVRPLGLFAAALVFLAFVPILGLPDAPLTVLLAAGRVFAVLTGTWGAWRSVDVAAEVLAALAAGTASRIDDVLIPLGRKTVKVFIAVFGLIYTAESLDIEIAPLIAGLGIGGLAFAFAAKDTIENFFGSVAVLVDRPFAVGDWIIVEDVDGTVEEIGFRSTRVRTFANSLVTVPNATLVRAKVDNYGRRRYRRFKTTIGVQYDTPPDAIDAFCEGIRELVRRHPYTRKDYYHVYLNDFGPSSLDILVYVFHEVPDWGTELRERHRFMADVIRLADRLGVSFAFPTQTVHLFQESRDEPRSASPSPGSDAERRSSIHGRRAARDLIREQPWREERPGPVGFDLDQGELEDDPEES